MVYFGSMKTTIAVAALLSWSCALGAQMTRCDSSALRTPIGVQVDTLRVLLRRADLVAPLPSQWALLALDEVRRNFAMPTALAFSAYVSGRTAGEAVTTAHASLLFDALADGDVRVRGMLARSGSDALDAALAAAVRLAGAQRAFAPLPTNSGRSLPLVAAVMFWQGDSLRAGMDLAELQLPRYRDFVALPQDSSTSNDEMGSVVQAIAMFDDRGRVLPETVDFFSVTDPNFARQLVRRTSSVTIIPVRIAGCAVPTLRRIVMLPPRD